jgi:uncharacterized protein
MKIALLPETYAICRLSTSAAIPAWAMQGTFFSINKTSDELSIVCEEKNVPEGIQSERSWRLLKVVGPLDFTLTGVLASVANPLARAQVSIFAISTFDTDYILVQSRNLEAAKTCLVSEGFNIN